MWTERWRTSLVPRADGTATTVLDDEGAVRGFARVGPVRDDDLAPSGLFEVRAIYLEPSAWGSRRGSLLLGAALDTVPADVPAVSLWVFAKNARARTFYERHGFEPDGRQQDLDIGGAALAEVRYRRLSSGSTTMVG